MLIYQVKETELRIGKDKGKKRFYASPIPQDRITTRQVEDRIVEATALSRADVRSAITALAQVVREEMFAGRSIDLADLGTFKVLSTGKYMETAKEVTAETLKTPRIIFYPKEAMRAQAKSVQRQILRDGESVPKDKKAEDTPGGDTHEGGGSGRPSTGI